MTTQGTNPFNVSRNYTAYQTPFVDSETYQVTQTDQGNSSAVATAQITITFELDNGH